MLRSIRSTLSSFLVLLLLGLLIASFALWGIGDIFRTASPTAVAEIEDTEISGLAYERAFRQRLRALEAQFGEPVDRSQAVQIGVHQQVLQSLISQSVLDMHARSLGLRATPVQVIEQLREIEAFEGFDGNFDRQAYEMQLQNAGWTKAEFEMALRNEIARTQLIEGITAKAPVPDPLARALFRYRNEARTATVVTVPASAVDEVEEPSEEEMRAAYEAEKGRYMAPEYRSVAVAEISPDQVAEPEAVTQTELEDAYAERIGEYQVPELRDVQIVTFGSNEKDLANRFVKALREGMAFADALAEFTDFTVDETSLGDMAEADLEADYSPRAAEAVFAAETGGITDPVQSVFGWHVFKINSLTEPVERSLADVAPQLRREVARENALDRVYDISVEAEEALARGAPLAEIAEGLGLALTQVEKVDRQGLMPGGESAPDAITEHLATAFSLQPEDEPALEPTEDEGFALVDVRAIYPPEQKSFEAVRDQVRARLIAERKTIKAGERADAAKAELEAGADPQTVAESVGGEVLDTGFVTRAEVQRGRGMMANLGGLLFELQPGDHAVEAAPLGDGYLVVRLNEVRTAEPGLSGEEFGVLKAQVERAMVNDILVQYEQSLREAYDVTVNETLVQRIVQPGES